MRSGEQTRSRHLSEIYNRIVKKIEKIESDIRSCIISKCHLLNQKRLMKNWHVQSNLTYIEHSLIKGNEYPIFLNYFLKY